MADQCWVAGLAYSPLPGRASPRRRFMKSTFPPLTVGSPDTLASPLPSPPITPSSTTPPPPRRGTATSPPPRPKSRTARIQAQARRHERQGSHDSLIGLAHSATSGSPPGSGSSGSGDVTGTQSPGILSLRETPTSPRVEPAGHLAGPKRIMLRELLPRILATPALENSPDDLNRFARLQTLALHIFQDPCAFDQDDLARFLAQPLALDELRTFSDTVIAAWTRAAPAAIRIPPNAPIRIVDPHSDLSGLDAAPLELCSAATCACLLWTNLHPERWLQIQRASRERGGGALDLSAEVRPATPAEIDDDALDLESATPIVSTGPSFANGFNSDPLEKGITRSGMNVGLWKVRMPAVADAGVVQKIRTALQPWQKASHAALVPLLGVQSSTDITTGAPAMTLVCGAATRSRLPYAMPKSTAEAYRMMRVLAKALRYLHQLRTPLVHGGIRPETILVAPTGEAQFAESGLAKILEDLASSTGDRAPMPSGALRYSAPELFGENRALAKRTTRSDVYAFGCIIYEVFSGEQPFADMSEGRVPRALYDGQTLRRPTPGQGLNINDELWSLIMRCCAFDLSRRPTMAQVVAALTTARSAEHRATAAAAASGVAVEQQSPNSTALVVTQGLIGQGTGPALEPSAIMALVECASKIAIPAPPLPILAN